MKLWLGLGCVVLVLGIGSLPGCGDDEPATTPATGGSAGATGGGAGTAGQQAGGAAGKGGTAGQGGQGMGGTAGSGTGGTAGTGTGGTAGGTPWSPPTLKASSDISKLDATSQGAGPWLVWDSAAFGVVWGRSGPDLPEYTREVNIAKLDATGAVAWSKPVPDSHSQSYPRLSAMTGGYAVVWEEEVEPTSNVLRFVTADSAGVLGTPKELSAQSPIGTVNPSYVVLAWTGEEFGLAWEAADSSGALPAGKKGLFFARCDKTGTLVGTPSVVEEGGARASLAWNGTEYGLAWVVGENTSYVKLARLNKTGQIQGTPTTVGGGSFVLGPSVAWGTQEWGVAWQDDQGNKTNQYDIRFAVLDAQAKAKGAPVKLTTGGFAGQPSVAWNGSGFGVVWGWYINEGTVEQPSIGFAEVNASGTMLGSTKLLSIFESMPYPSLAWAGNGYGVVYRDLVNNKGTILFARQ